MKKEKRGFQEATKILQELDEHESERILGEIGKKNAELAILLRKNLMSFEDLVHLPVTMISTLMKEITPEMLGLAFRAASPEVKSHFLDNVPSLMRQEIEEVLKGPLRALSDVLASRQKILEIVQAKIKAGEIFLDKGKGNKKK